MRRCPVLNFGSCKRYLSMPDNLFYPDSEHWGLTTSFPLIVPFLYSWFKFCHLYPAVSFFTPAISWSSPVFLFSPVSCIFTIVTPALSKESSGILLFVNYAVVISLLCRWPIIHFLNQYVVMEGVGCFSFKSLSAHHILSMSHKYLSVKDSTLF